MLAPGFNNSLGIGGSGIFFTVTAVIILALGKYFFGKIRKWLLKCKGRKKRRTNKLKRDNVFTSDEGNMRSKSAFN